VGFGGPVHGRGRCQEPMTADDQPPSMRTRARPAGGLRPTVRHPVLEPGPAPQLPRLPARPAAPAGSQQTLTRLAGAEPITGAPASRGPVAAMVPLGVSLGPRTAQPAPRPAVARGPCHRPHDAGVLVLDETGDRKDGTATAHVARQYLGSVGKIDNRIVAVTACGLTSAAAGRSMRCPTHQHPGWPRPRATRGSGPSRSSPSSCSRPPAGWYRVPGGGRLLLRRQP
jgi:DDE superfamily endonuclease